MNEAPVWEKLIRCDFCPPDDNEWPESAFRGAGSAYDRKDGKRCCTACFDERYPARRTRCHNCLRLIDTRGGAEETICAPCRQGKTPDYRATCLECGVSASRRQISYRTGICASCRSVETERQRRGLEVNEVWEVVGCQVCERLLRRKPGDDRSAHRKCDRLLRRSLVEPDPEG